MFFPGGPFQPNLIFESKAGAYPSGARTDTLTCNEEKRFYSFDTWSQSYKTFFFVTGEDTKKARVFVPGGPFQPDLRFECKAGAYPSGTPFC